jgi:hypothetical protein
MRIAIALLVTLIPASVGDSEICEAGSPCSVQVSIDFRADIRDGAGVRAELEPLWDDTYRLTYTAYRTGPEAWSESGEALITGAGEITIAAVDGVELEAPETIAILPIGSSTRFAASDTAPIVRD